MSRSPTSGSETAPCLDLGGAILNEGGDLTLERVVVDLSKAGRSSTSPGAAIASVTGRRHDPRQYRTHNTALGDAAPPQRGTPGCPGAGIHIGLGTPS